MDRIDNLFGRFFFIFEGWTLVWRGMLEIIGDGSLVGRGILRKF